MLLLFLGKCAKIWEENSPSWVPTLNMGYDTADKERRKSSMDVSELRLRQNKSQTIVHNGNNAAGPTSENATQMEVDNVTEPLTECDRLRAEIALLKSKNGEQAKEIDEYRTTVQMLLSENLNLKKKLTDSEISLDGFRDNDEKTTYFFGLSSFPSWNHCFRNWF